MLTRRALLGGLAGSTLLAHNASAAAPRTLTDSDGHDYPIRMRRKVEVLYQSPRRQSQRARSHARRALGR